MREPIYRVQGTPVAGQSRRHKVENTAMNRHFTITKDQRQAVWKLFLRNPDGATSYREFRKRVAGGYGPYIMIVWCNMVVGIEVDGHAHT